MIVFEGRPQFSCEGLHRREWLRVGGLGAIGLTLTDLLRSHATANDPGRAPVAVDRRRLHTNDGFGRARSCIVLFLFGAPAHQDIWDLKPAAPAEIRGEFRPIASAVPGTVVGEHIPRLAKLTDRITLIRSVTHPDNTHTVAMHYMLSGVRHLRPRTNPENAPDDFPCYGAIANYVQHAASDRAGRGSRLPAAVSLNSPANQVSANNHIFPGFFAGFLGRAYDPLFVPRNANAADFEPLPTLQESRDRLAGRRSLLKRVDESQIRGLPETGAGILDAYYEKAFDLLTSTATRRAFDLQREPAAVRGWYGGTPFGQGCLLARRLVEAGVRLVTVNWERDDAFWDTHKNNFADLKNKLLPNFDRGCSALLRDLEQRGLLDETLVVCLGEFGRTPKINQNAGRDHWAPCNSVVLAGAGIPGGQVYGASDRMAAYPDRDPVTPEDLAATIYHLLGIAPRTTITDPLGRPLPISTGRPLVELL